MRPHLVLVAAVTASAVAGWVVRAASPPVPSPDPPDPAQLLAFAPLSDAGPPAAPARIALAWRPPSSCAWTYEVHVEEEMETSVAELFNRRPERSRATFVLMADDDTAGAGDGHAVRARAELRSNDMGVRPFASTEPNPVALSRDVWIGPRGLGPAAPDAVCRNRSWDPVDDLLALAWPWLPAHRVAPGEHWRGARVGGRCGETACLTPEGTAGERAHALTCLAADWDEQLVGVVEMDGEPWAAVIGRWRDRDDLDDIDGGVVTERRALIAAESGRLRWAQAVVDHRWSGIRRRIVVEAVDDCAGTN